MHVEGADGVPPHPANPPPAPSCPAPPAQHGVHTPPTAAVRGAPRTFRPPVAASRHPPAHTHTSHPPPASRQQASGAATTLTLGGAFHQTRPPPRHPPPPPPPARTQAGFKGTISPTLALLSTKPSLQLRASFLAEAPDWGALHNLTLALASKKPPALLGAGASFKGAKYSGVTVTPNPCRGGAAGWVGVHGGGAPSRPTPAGEARLDGAGGAGPGRGGVRRVDRWGGVAVTPSPCRGDAAGGGGEGAGGA